MNALFQEGRTIEARTIREWGELAADPASNIRLPAFQRSAAWDERRVELLWDSVTRDFPIGALLFARPGTAVLSKALPDAPMGATQRLRPGAAPLLLIDGQQRLTALKTGFHLYRDELVGRLWVDLAPPRGKEAGRRGRFRFCSRVHPWGWGVSVARKRKARALIGAGDRIDDVNLPLSLTWPLDARVPVDAVSFILRTLGAPTVTPGWEDLLPPGCRPEEADLREVGGPGGLPAVVEGIRRLGESRLVGLLVGATATEALGESFARLNSQGVPMSQEELFFSALKLRWPESSDLVAGIVDDPHAGRLLPATKIVHLATRIAVSTAGGARSDVDYLTLEGFEDLEKQSGDKLVSGLRGLLAKSSPGDGEGRMHAALSVARRILQHRDTPERSDPGLPRTLLGSLHWRSWHAVAGWAERHCLAAEEVDEESRLEVIRLVLLLHFFVPTGKSFVAREAFRLARADSARQFPGRGIAAALLAEGLVSIAPLDPEHFRAWLANQEGRGEGSATGPRLANERDLLHLAQRHWLSAWYPSHDPTLYHSADDLPYDVDHIMPAHAFDGRGGTWCALFQRDAAALRSSIGNLRLWPREANRSDQAATPDKKLFLDEAPDATLKGEPLLEGRPCSFRTAGDVRAASITGEDERESWLMTRGPLKDWSDAARATALRQAVDERRARLYEVLWQTAGFGAWWKGIAS